MAGKASLLLVMGFSLIFLVFGHNFNTMSTRTVENFTDYYSKTVAHDLASTGANIGANAVFLDGGWTAGYQNLQMNGGEVDVRVEIVNAGQNIRKIISESTFGNETHTIEVILAPSRFSKFAYYSEDEGNNIRWTGKDTVYGPFHTQSNLLVDNHPVFGVMGYRTTIKGSVLYADYRDYYPTQIPQNPSGTTQTNRYNASKADDKPVFHGSFEDGIDEPLVSNGLQPLKDAANDNGKMFNLTSTSTTRYEDFYLTFKGDSITYTIEGEQKTGGSWNDFTTTATVLASSLAPNGVVYLDGTNRYGNPLDLRLKGTVKGKFSVVGDGNIYLDDDIVYQTDPKTNPNSTDLLGILSQNNVYITDNNDTKNINIHAAIYCQDGGFGAENYNSRSVDGNINLLGGITQHIRRAVGTYSGSTSVSGFNKKYGYDKRLMKIHPPFFPTTSGFSIVSWKE